MFLCICCDCLECPQLWIHCGESILLSTSPSVISNRRKILEIVIEMVWYSMKIILNISLVTKQKWLPLDWEVLIHLRYSPTDYYLFVSVRLCACRCHICCWHWNQEFEFNFIPILFPPYKDMNTFLLLLIILQERKFDS